MRIHSTSFLLKIVLVYKSGKEQVIEYTGNMPERVVIPVKITESNPAILKSVKLNNIYINTDKLPIVAKFQIKNKKWPEPNLNFSQSGDLIFDLFSIDPILYLLSIENTIAFNRKN
jgi:hypothetical protein